VARRFANARSIALDISPLRDSVPYRALWIGQVISLFGSNMRLVAVPWQIFELTRSTLAVGMVGLAEIVPLIVFSILGGTLADRYNRKAIVLWSQLGLIVCAFGLTFVALSDDPSIPWIYGLTALSSAFNALDRPARTSMMPSLVDAGKLQAVLALRQVAFQTTQILGPMIGGFLIASFDVSVVYAIDAVTFAAAIISLRWIPPMAGFDVHDETAWSSVKEGLRFVTRTPLILSILVIDLVAMIFGMPRAVFPALAERVFDMGPQGLGILYAGPSFGALIGALTTGWVGRVRRQGLAVLISVAAWGLAIALAGLATFSVPLTVLFLAFAGWADVISAVFRGTMLLESAPDSLRGRTQAVNLMVVTGGPRLGDIEAGLAASAFGVVPSIVLGGAACLAGTLLVAALFPQLRTYLAPISLQPDQQNPDL
jgi:Transmembrane secretion effector